MLALEVENSDVEVGMGRRPGGMVVEGDSRLEAADDAARRFLEVDMDSRGWDPGIWLASPEEYAM